jgi:hypothetical protein
MPCIQHDLFFLTIQLPGDVGVVIQHVLELDHDLDVLAAAYVEFVALNGGWLQGFCGIG